LVRPNQCSLTRWGSPCKQNRSPTAVQGIEKTSIQYSCLSNSGTRSWLEIHDWYPTATSLHWVCRVVRLHSTAPSNQKFGDVKSRPLCQFRPHSANRQWHAL